MEGMRAPSCSIPSGGQRVAQPHRMPPPRGPDRIARPRPAGRLGDPRSDTGSAVLSRPAAAGGASHALSGSTASSDMGLARADYGLFVKFFRGATPYIQGHRGRTFVIALPGDVVDRPDLMDQLMEDKPASRKKQKICT